MAFLYDLEAELVDMEVQGDLVASKVAEILLEEVHNQIHAGSHIDSLVALKSFQVVLQSHDYSG